MNKRTKALAALTMGMALSAQTSNAESFKYERLPDLGELYPYAILPSFNGPIFTPRKHTKMKYADHKRMKAKRKNKR